MSSELQKLLSAYRDAIEERESTAAFLGPMIHPTGEAQLEAVEEKEAQARTALTAKFEELLKEIEELKHGHQTRQAGGPP